MKEADVIKAIQRMREEDRGIRIKNPLKYSGRKKTDRIKRKATGKKTQKREIIGIIKR